MSEQRLIDTSMIKVHKIPHEMNGHTNLDTVENYLYNIPTIDPETLPIVQELMKKLSEHGKIADARMRVIKKREETIHKLKEKLAEYEPVHAHWELYSKTKNRGYKCSHCKKGRISNSDYCSVNHRNYCYNCGAIMDEEVK